VRRTGTIIGAVHSCGVVDDLCGPAHSGTAQSTYEGKIFMINSKRKMLLGAVLSLVSVVAIATPAEAYWHHHHRHYWHHHHRAYVKVHL